MQKRKLHRIILPSIAEHVKFCENLPRPWGKAKYYLMTDSDYYRDWERWKEPRKGSEIETETKCLQAVVAMYMYAQPRAFCIMSQRVIPMLQG